MKRRIKKIISCLLIATMLSGTANVAYAEDSTATVDLTDGLIAHYDFENVSGTTVSNTVGDTYPGTLSGDNVSIEADGLLGSSLKFTDGTEGHMYVENILNTGTTSYSLSMWYKYDTSFNREGKRMVLFQQSGSGRTLLTFTSGSRYHTYVNATDVESDGTVNLEEWQHVTYVYDSENQQVKFYINGVLDSTKSAGTNEVNALTNLLIGRHKNGGSDPWSMRGLVDEIRVYDKVVTDAEAQAIYEEKAGSIKYPILQEKIAEAEEVYASNGLDASVEAAVALKDAIDTAKELTNTVSYAELSAAMTALETAIAEYHDAVGVFITLDTSVVERTIDESIFGINHRYGFNGYGSFDSETMQMKEDFVELYEEAGFGSIRYPGGTISNLFQWKTSIGPKENRVNQIHGFYNNSGQNGIAPNFGLDEIGTFADEVGSEIVYVYGFGRGSAQDAADLIEYLNAPVGSNPNGGVAWASVRAANGHEEPYNVRYFEIGNENQQAWGGSDGTASQGYWMTFVNQVSEDGTVGDAVGSEDAYIEGGTVVRTKEYAVLKDNWNQAVSGSTGEANQVRYMRYANPNPMTGEDGTELVEDFEAVVRDSVHVYVNDVEWTIVDSLEGQAADAQVVTVDYRDGSFTFGDGVHGAIPAAGASINVSYNVERDGFVDVAGAMKETTQAINEYYAEQGINKEAECYTYSSYESQGFVNKMAERGYNDYYDGLTIHPYSGTPSGTGEAFYDSAMQLAENTGIAHVQNYVNMLPEGKVPVISEYGIFRSTDSLVRSQTHALYIARVLMEYVRLGSPYIQKHCLVDWYSSGADSLGPTQQAVIQAVPQEGANTATGEGEFKFFATPSARVFEMICKNFGTEIIPTEFSYMEEMSNGVDEFASLASKDAEGNIYLAVVNLDREEDQSMNLVVEGMDVTGRTVEIQTLAGDSFDAENTLEDPDNVDIETSTQTAESNTITFTAKAHSFNVIKLTAITATDITLNKTALNLETGKTETLTATVLPENTENKTVTWSTSDATVATVADGVVTAVKAGTATITVTTANGLTATCAVTVTAPAAKPDDTQKPEDTQKPDDTTTPGDETPTVTLPKKNAKVVINGATYKVTKPALTGGTVSFAKPKKNAKTVTIPATVKIDGITYKVTAIDKNAFKGNKKVKKVTIGNNVTTIGANAFSGCTALTAVKLGTKVTTINTKAFFGCKKLTSIILPKSVKKIGASAFANCKRLKKITIQSSKLTKKTLAKTAFKGINKSTRIEVPKNKVKAYKTLFKSKGLSSKVKVTK